MFEYIKYNNWLRVLGEREILKSDSVTRPFRQNTSGRLIFISTRRGSSEKNSTAETYSAASVAEGFTGKSAAFCYVFFRKVVISIWM